MLRHGSTLSNVGASGKPSAAQVRGDVAELAGCARLKAILAEVRFPQPARRRITLDLAHVEAFIPKAIEMGRVSFALATTVQFDTTLRQKNVIGE